MFRGIANRAYLFVFGVGLIPNVIRSRILFDCEFGQYLRVFRRSVSFIGHSLRSSWALGSFDGVVNTALTDVV